MMNHQALLALLGDLYSQVAHLTAENGDLKEMLAKQSGGPSSQPDVPPGS